MLVLPQRQTALVAKQAAEVDLLSGGRLVLGVGTGWNHVEYTSLGTTFGDRARRFDDQVDVLRALWQQELVDHDSPFHRIERAGLVPRPGRSIPLWMGGSAEASLARAARVGDGHIFAGSTDRHFDAAAPARRAARRARPRPRRRSAWTCSSTSPTDPTCGTTGPQRWEAFGGSLMSMRSMTTGTSFLGVAGGRPVRSRSSTSPRWSGSSRRCRRANVQSDGKLSTVPSNEGGSVSVPINIPKLGVSMTEGTIVEWLVADGDQVPEGQPLYLIETDKVENEVEATASGTMRITGEEGETYPVGESIGEIEA